jgi:hypothetical protein
MVLTTTARGYGAKHQRRRRQALAALIDGTPCSRCFRAMYRWQALDLDHSDDRTAYLGLAHRRCNQLVGARKGGRVTAARRRIRTVVMPLATSRRW